MVRAKPSGERAKTAHEEGSESAASAAPQAAVAETPVAATSDNVEKCVNCQYYDRRRARPTDGKAPMWGQCRRHSPHLNPVTAKAYVVEGVWPLVRDDDWCGEWHVLTRMPQEPLPETTALAADGGPAPARPRAAPASPPATGAVVTTSGD